MERIIQDQADAQDEARRTAAREARSRSFRGSQVGRFVGRLSRAASVLARALVGQRTVGRDDTGWVSLWAAILLAAAAVGFVWPRVVAWPFAFFVFWLAVAAIVRVRSGRRRGDESM